MISSFNDIDTARALIPIHNLYSAGRNRGNVVWVNSYLDQISDSDSMC